jgi:hypothetical protein
MLTSTYFKIRKRKVDDWFDTILDADTQLFVDPFLVFKDTAQEWADAHSDIIKHFNHAFLLIAEGNMNTQSLPYQKALALLLFHEPNELCLGYTSQGTAGLGSGRGFAKTIAAAIAEAVGRGLSEPRHFEELGILNEGIGPDRISDITCTILKARLLRYTQAVAQRHNIPLDRHSIYGASFDARRLRWETPEVEVPTNPFTGGPLLFVPQRFLQDLPVINAYAWWNSYENEQLREDVNYEIMGHVDKATIIEVARRNPEAVRRWTAAQESAPADPYDFERDPKGVWQWDLASANFVKKNPLVLAPATTDGEFFTVIDEIIRRYRLFIEDQGGWSLLWDTSRHREKPEQAAQLLFRGMAQEYCRANDISLDAEVNLGRGPVDFKFSNGYRRRAHLEVKKVHNGKFWEGLERQLPSYMRSDELVDGWFLAIQYRNNKTSRDRARQLPARVLSLAQAEGLNLRYGLVNALPKNSASKL